MRPRRTWGHSTNLGSRRPTLGTRDQLAIKSRLKRRKIHFATGRVRLYTLRREDLEATMRSNDAVFVISVAARLAGMHANTLRKYEREQLLSPARTDSNLRLYSSDDIATLRQIQTLSEERGANVAGIRLAPGVAEEVRRLRRDVADDHAIGSALPEQQRALVARLDRVLEKLGFHTNR